MADKPVNYVNSTHSIDSVMSYITANHPIGDKQSVLADLKIADKDQDGFLSFKESQPYFKESSKYPSFFANPSDHWSHVSPWISEHNPFTIVPIDYKHQQNPSKKIVLIIDGEGLDASPRFDIDGDYKIDEFEFIRNHSMAHSHKVKLSVPDAELIFLTDRPENSYNKPELILEKIKKVLADNPNTPIVVSSSAAISSQDISESELYKLVPEASKENYHQEPYRTKILETLKRNDQPLYERLMHYQAIVETLGSNGVFITAIGNNNLINLAKLVGVKLVAATDEEGNPKPFNANVA